MDFTAIESLREHIDGINGLLLQAMKKLNKIEKSFAEMNGNPTEAKDVESSSKKTEDESTAIEIVNDTDLMGILNEIASDEKFTVKLRSYPGFVEAVLDIL